MSQEYHWESATVRHIREALFEAGSAVPILLVSTFLFQLTSPEQPALYLLGLLFVYATVIIFFHNIYSYIRDTLKRAWADAIPPDELSHEASFSEIMDEYKVSEYIHPAVSDKRPQAVKPPLIYGLRQFFVGFLLYWVSLVLVTGAFYFRYFPLILSKIKSSQGVGYFQFISISAESILGWMGALLNLLLPSLSMESALFLILTGSLPAVPLLFAVRNFVNFSKAVHWRVLRFAVGSTNSSTREIATLAIFVAFYGTLLYV